MKILIFEGISTSGKSTVIKLLTESIVEPKVKVLKEKQTHVPIMNKTNEDHQHFFMTLVNGSCADKPDFLIVDRLYMTQAFRAHLSIQAYSELENLLAKYNALTIFLKVDETSIADRVIQAESHRNSQWSKHIRAKGNSADEIADYYINQQRNQLQLLESSIIPYKIFNTTNHNYDDIASIIKKSLKI